MHSHGPAMQLTGILRMRTSWNKADSDREEARKQANIALEAAAKQAGKLEALEELLAAFKAREQNRTDGEENWQKK
jgi:hypothetical protein